MKNNTYDVDGDSPGGELTGLESVVCGDSSATSELGIGGVKTPPYSQSRVGTSRSIECTGNTRCSKSALSNGLQKELMSEIPPIYPPKLTWFFALNSKATLSPLAAVILGGLKARAPPSPTRTVCTV